MNLITNGRLITRDTDGKGYYEHGAVAFEGTKIVEVGEEAALRAKYADAHIIDAKGGVIMPAFINAHTHTCRRWRQVRDLVIAQTEGRPLLSACHVSGSEGRRRGDSLRNLFVPQLQSDERNSKNHWFLAAFFPPFLPLLEEMGPPEAQSREGGVEPRPYADVRNFIVFAAQWATPTLAAAGGRCAIW